MELMELLGVKELLEEAKNERWKNCSNHPSMSCSKAIFKVREIQHLSQKKWLLVNIQDACEFQCQVLNRDVWSNEAVKIILREHFVFWQQYKESEEAQRYVTFYPVTEWPYVAILDPRTGELMVTWQKLDAATFCDLVTEFLSLHPNLGKEDSSEMKNETKNESVAKRKKSTDTNSILDADEDDQLAAAIAASLKETSKERSKPTEDNDSSDSDSDSDLIESFSAENSNSAPLPAISSNTAKTEINTKVASEKDDVVTSWEEYLGDKEDPLSSIMIRFPDGNRVTKEIPCSSQFLAIVEFVKSKGYTLDQHEIVTNYPRRILTDLDTKQTLKELGLFPKEMVIVQQK